MKKILTFILTLTFMLMPLSSFAAPGGIGLAQYAPTGSDTLLFGSFVCKLSTCFPPPSLDDWFNYSATGVGIPFDVGKGQTLVVAPGNNLSFVGMVVYETDSGEGSLNPVLDLELTNGQYLENINYFAGSNADADGDGNSFVYDENLGSFNFTNSLANDDGEVGFVTAKIKEGTPDGTIITGKLSLDDGQFGPIILDRAFASSAYAEEVAQSTFRVLVRNTETSANTETVQTLPKTGENINWYDKMLPYGVVAVFILFIGFQLARKKRTN